MMMMMMMMMREGGSLLGHVSRRGEDSGMPHIGLWGFPQRSAAQKRYFLQRSAESIGQQKAKILQK